MKIGSVMIFSRFLFCNCKKLLNKRNLFKLLCYKLYSNERILILFKSRSWLPKINNIINNIN